MINFLAVIGGLTCICSLLVCAIVFYSIYKNNEEYDEKRYERFEEKIEYYLLDKYENTSMDQVSSVLKYSNSNVIYMKELEKLILDFIKENDL